MDAVELGHPCWFRSRQQWWDAHTPHTHTYINIHRHTQTWLTAKRPNSAIRHTSKQPRANNSRKKETQRTGSVTAITKREHHHWLWRLAVYILVLFSGSIRAICLRSAPRPSEKKTLTKYKSMQRIEYARLHSYDNWNIFGFLDCLSLSALVRLSAHPNALHHQ